MKLRHEINVLDSVIDSIDSGYFIGDAYIAFDKSSWNGTVSFYHEIVAKNISAGDEGVYLYDITNLNYKGGINVPANTSSYTKFRSSVISLNAGMNEYNIRITQTPVAADVQVKVARVVILQDTSTSNLTDCETQIEIGDYGTELFTSEAIEPLAYPKYWYYDSAKWDGTLTIYGEVTWQCINDKEWLTVYIEEDDGSFANWTQVSTVLNQGGSETVTRTRGADFSAELTSGRNYRLAIATEGTKAAYGVNIFNAKLIIQQTDATEITLLEPQYLLVNTGKTGTGLQDYDQLYDADEWDGVTVDIYPEHDASGAASETKIQEDPSTAELLDSYTDSPAGSGSTTQRYAQSFSSGSGGKLSSAKFKLYITSGATGNVFAKLYAHSGTFGTSSVPTGSALATSDAIDVSTITTDTAGELVEFLFSARYTFTASTYYCISIEWAGLSQNLWIKLDTSFPTHGGNYASGDPWVANNSRDLTFYVYINTVPNSSITGANRVRGGTALSITDDETIDTNIVVAS